MLWLVGWMRFNFYLASLKGNKQRAMIHTHSVAAVRPSVIQKNFGMNCRPICLWILSWNFIPHANCCSLIHNVASFDYSPANRLDTNRLAYKKKNCYLRAHAIETNCSNSAPSKCTNHARFVQNTHTQARHKTSMHINIQSINRVTRSSSLVISH